MSSRKIIEWSTLKRKIARHRQERKKIAFTNGCFDILHAGHVQYLQKAKKSGRILIVGLNSDVSVRKIKGTKRPIVPQSERALVLAALACVDYITLFDEETPEQLIGFLKPDILIKGEDWRGKDVAGADLVRQWGGKVEYATFRPGVSSTNIIEKIIKKCAK